MKQNKNRLRDTEIKVVVPKGEEGGAAGEIGEMHLQV